MSGHNRGLFTLGRGQQVEWRYEVECVRRGRVGLGTVHARFWDRAGLEAGETSVRVPAELRVYPRPLPLRRLPSPRRMQAFVGNYVAPSVGEGLEPGDIRAFVPGDRIRHVNWRASLRFRKLFVTRYHQERNADIVLMLDSLSEAGTPPATTLDASIRAAAALATSYLARKDRVGLIEYCGPFRWVRPSSGRTHHERLFEALLRADVMFSYVTQEVALVPRRILPPQALVIAISPLLDPALREGAGRSGGAGLRPGGAEPVTDPTRAARDAAVGAGRPGVPAVGAGASRARRRAPSARHHDRRLGPRSAAGGRAGRPDALAAAGRGALTMRRFASVLALVLVSYPLLIAPSPAVVALGAAALIVCILGILVATHVLVAGVVLALAEYTLALWIGGGPPRLAGGVVLGVVLLLLVETADFGRRAHGAVIGPGVVLAQLRAWALFGSLAGMVAVLASVVASVASAAVRLPWAPAVAAAGAAVALVGVALALSAVRVPPRP